MRIRTLLPVGLVALSLGCGGDTEEATEMAAEYPDAVAADPGHYSVEFENDAVRVLRVRYEPGESSEMHTHPPLCSIAIEGGSWEMTNADGTAEDASNETGAVNCGTEGTTHIPENTGDTPNEGILIEMKEGGMAGSDWMPEEANAAEADPDHYTVEAENDVVRMVRVRYGAGETSVMHSHPAHCVIYLQDGSTTFELPSGEVVDAPPGEVGSVQCNDGGIHLPTNTGDSDIEVVLVELKGRATFGG